MERCVFYSDAVVISGDDSDGGNDGDKKCIVNSGSDDSNSEMEVIGIASLPSLLLPLSPNHPPAPY